jgi:hypothetical protein
MILSRQRGVRLAPLLLGLALTLLAQAAAAADGDLRPFLPAPIWVYNNWSAYDELSDSVPLTEVLAMRELDEVVRLRKLGVRFDYYVMDAFWYAPDGAYRTWRTDSWPDGPGRWIDACKENGILPGLWFSSNSLTQLLPAPRWEGSLTGTGTAMSLESGEFLDDLVEVLQYWYDEGIRLFKFDFADFSAVAADRAGTAAEQGVRARNARAFRAALTKFRQANPGVVLVAFNGFGGDMGSTAAPFPFEDPVDVRWLKVFDALFSGDPRPADVPEMDFWRSVDIYSDHMVRRYEESGVPLPRIDATSAMIGTTGTDYVRGTSAWQGMLLLTAARGGWINTVHGNLELLDDEKARWLAKLQAMYEPLQRAGTTRMFGGIPGEVEPYGFASTVADGALYTVVNPRQSVELIPLPESASAPSGGARRVLFRDDGFVPELEGDAIRLGPGQLALVGAGRYASADYDLGVQRDVVIPRTIEPVPAVFSQTGGGEAVEAEIVPPKTGDLRVVLQQRDGQGSIVRSTTEQSMGGFLVIEATQGDARLPVDIRYDKVVWSGLSWGVGEIRHADLAPGEPVRIRLSSADHGLQVEGRVYRVEY